MLGHKDILTSSLVSFSDHLLQGKLDLHCEDTQTDCRDIDRTETEASCQKPAPAHQPCK